MIPLLMLAALQQPAPPPPPAAPRPAASPIARAEVNPREAAVLVGDSLQLRVTAWDSSGVEYRDVSVRWFAAATSMFEGSVSQEGMVLAGSVGTMSVTAMVRAANGGPPVAAVGRVTILPQPAARLAVEGAPARLYTGQSLVLRAQPFAANGDLRHDEVAWSSDQPRVATVWPSGRLTALMPGKATLTARAGRASETVAITVVANPVTQVAIEPAEARARTGDVIPLSFVARGAKGPVADAVPEWSLIPGNGQVDPDGRFVADLPGTYRVLASFAGRTAEAVVTVSPRDVRRPTTLVGRLPLKLTAAEFWLHPDGRHGYITTIGDRVYAVDLGERSKPVITDSVVVDARIINDLMTTEDGRFGVLTREGASTRKNGIVVLSFEDPAHPKVIAEYTETVSGGVHSTYVYRGHVYLTDDATGSLRVIDIQDPYHPREVARWETSRLAAGRMLHDVDVRDGLAYLSYWNDGLVILDVGNGLKGGSPEHPQLVSQLKYDLDGLYREVEAVGGPGFIRGTHTAWRSGRYVFVGDEVFSARPRPTEGGTVVGLGRAYGRLHVVDVSDIEHPRIVAWYEPKDGGTHNVWVAGDTLYLGDYQGGLRVVDVSGELRGDLLRQGREIAHVVTGDTQGVQPNFANAWGAIYRDGYVYVPDMNSGLWIVQVDPKSELTP